MCIRIQLSRSTVKGLSSRLQHAYQRDDVRVVRRTTGLLDLLVHHVPVEVLRERWGLSTSGIYPWRQAVLLRGRDSVVSHHGGGRRPQLTPRQKQRLGELLEAGPLVVGFEPACWNAVLLRVLIWRECGVLYQRPYICTLLHNLGVSFHQARFVSDHRDAAKRLAWLQDTWPAIFRAAKRCQGGIRCEAEASFAQWGALRSTWARRGRQPEVPTSGTRKGYKVFGAIDSVSGRLCSPGIEGRCNAASYHAFWQMIMAHTTEHLFLIHAGARYHTRAATTAFLAAPRERLTAHPFPSYAPDYHPMEYRWKKTKQRATHHKYRKECAALTVSVDKALTYFATQPETVLGLFGRYGEESGLELKQAA